MLPTVKNSKICFRSLQKVDPNLKDETERRDTITRLQGIMRGNSDNLALKDSFINELFFRLDADMFSFLNTNSGISSHIILKFWG